MRGFGASGAEFVVAKRYPGAHSAHNRSDADWLAPSAAR